MQRDLLRGKALKISLWFKRKPTATDHVAQCIAAADELLKVAAFFMVIDKTHPKYDFIKYDLKRALSKYHLLRERIRHDYK